jgi:hypothetical protein
MLIVPRPEQPLRIWLGTGGSPESVLRAVELRVPLFLGILGRTPEHWAQYGRAYRGALSAVATLRKDERSIAIIGGTVGVPLGLFPVLAALELAGAAGILVGLWLEPLGLAPWPAGVVDRRKP